MDTVEKKEVLCFAEYLISSYFKVRDVEVLLNNMEERVSWIGSGEGEVSRNIGEARLTLWGEMSEYDGDFNVTDLSLEAALLSPSAWVVYGEIKAVPSSQEISDEKLRLTLVVEQTGEGLKLVHMHSSHADPDQKQGEHFVKQVVRGGNQSLRQELNMRERQLANLTENIPGGAHQCANDPNLTLLSMSRGFLSMFGYTREEIIKQFEGKFINMVYPGDRAGVIKSTYEQLKEGTEIELEYRVLCKNGQPIWVLDKGRLIDDGQGGRCFYCLLIDITERQRQQEELRLSLERHQVIMNQATDIIFEWDILQDTLEFSPNWKKKFGYDAIDTRISGRIPFSDNIHREDMPSFLKIMSDTAAGVPYSETEFRICDISGRYYWCRIRATTQFNSDNRPIKAVGVIVDIDEEKKQKQALIAQAQHDMLTGIYNKATIQALVEQRMPGAEVPGYEAMLIIDVDYFKAVNDTYGHLCGDNVLSDVASALRGCTRFTDLVGRIGGDEFLVYLPEISDKEAALRKMEHILEAVRCIRPENSAPSITCSIGAVVFPHGKADYQTLYRYADQALYKQKNSSRGGAAVFGEEDSEGSRISAVSSTIASDEGKVVDEWIAQYAFRTLYAAKNIEDALNRMLEIVGQSFDVSRVYIFESSQDGKLCSNTFEWCGEGITPQMELLQNITYVNELDNYISNFNEQGIFYCHDIETLNPNVCEILKPQGIFSMLQCAMLDEGEFVGYVGFDECRENRAWSPRQVSSFKLTADVLSTFLIKFRQKQRNEEQKERL